MTDPQLEAARLFVTSLLESLGERDRFQLATFDVEAAWASPAAVPATAENRTRALDHLAARRALGWSDFEKAFGEASARARPGTHVVYVGDGIPGRGDADPGALAGRLRQLYRGSGTFHAVAVGSTRELIVLRAIAGLGGGSLRQVVDGAAAAGAAGDLLRELGAPALKSIQLEWSGVQVARQYP